MFKDLTVIDKSILSIVFLIVISGVAVSFVSEEIFLQRIVVEDGFVEWLTVLGLLSCSGLALSRFVSGKRSGRNAAYLTGLLLTVVVFAFGAGEEISWGQRLLGIESPEFFEQNNAQRETNLHNLVVGGTKLNRLIFGQILAVGVVSFAFGLPWIWSQSTKIRDLTAQWAVPVPRLTHSLIYLALFLIISSVESGKRGELLEFAGSFVFFLMIFNPVNADIFRNESDETPEQELELVNEDSANQKRAA